MRRAALLLLAGCALTSRSAPIPVHYFTPPLAPAAGQHGPVCARLRLERVRASDYLGYRLAHRRSRVEIALDDVHRWTEHPHEYVRRALEQSLFDEHPLARAFATDAPSLAVEVTRFEDAGRSGAVVLRYQLATDSDVLASGTVSVARPADGPDTAAVVIAVGQALDAAARELADRVQRSLCPV